MTSEPTTPAEDGPLPLAWRLELERFSDQLIRMARKHLGGRLENKVDPEDVVQSAYKSLLLRYGDAGLGAESWQGLWGLLTTITVRKCADRARYHQAEKRDVRREAAAAPADGFSPWMAAVSREPTPEHAAMLSEVMADLFNRLEADERTMIELSLQGFSTQEISEQTGRAERSVRRLRERVRKFLERQQTQLDS
ncbi:RNA polymerase sigma factor [Anatilimnocola floriformis]|uniref:RNA polymerase sigma factor n=1 Tax=Anatilimnocola floriformis TaxID=2948575 RepID=UPI0020C4ACDB|nr:sigma-70 family RNA polymerase sigma factor [Anatilimnocola floriformis]